MFLSGLMSNIKECFISPSRYVAIHKKDDDIIQILTRQWINKYSLWTDCETKSDIEINKIAKNIFQDLGSISIDDSNADMVIDHLVKIAKESKRLKRAMISKIDNLKCEHKDLINRLYAQLNSVYTPKF